MVNRLIEIYKKEINITKKNSNRYNGLSNLLLMLLSIDSTVHIGIQNYIFHTEGLRPEIVAAQ